MPKLTVFEKNNAELRIKANALKPPFNKAVECAFIGKKRGEGFLPQTNKLNRYDREVYDAASKINSRAKEEALKKLFGPNTTYKSIFDYRESAIPEPPSDFEEKKRLYREKFNEMESKAIELADRENAKREKRLRRNSRAYKELVSKYQHKLTMESVFGKNSPYKSLAHYRYRGKSENEWSIEPEDWKEKYKQYEKLEKRLKEKYIKELAKSDKSIVEKDLCVAAHNAWHNKVNKLLLTRSEGEGFAEAAGVFNGKNKKLLGDAVSDALNFGQPKFKTVLFADVNVVYGGAISFTEERADAKKYNRDIKKYFKRDAVMKALKESKKTYGSKVLPEGWYNIESEDIKNRFTFSQPFQLKNSPVLYLPIDNIDKIFSEKSDFPVPIVQGNKENDKWRVREISQFGKDERRLPNKPKAVKEAFCYMDSYEKAWDFGDKLRKEKRGMDRVEIKEKMANVMKNELKKCREKNDLPL